LSAIQFSLFSTVNRKLLISVICTTINEQNVDTILHLNALKDNSTGTNSFGPNLQHYY